MGTDRIISLSMMGRFGNQVMSYLFARAHANRVGAVLYCEPWLGDEVFTLPQENYQNRKWDGNRLPRRDCQTLGAEDVNVEIRCYAQSQEAMIYTKAEAREWLTLRYNLGQVFNVPEAMGAYASDYLVGHVRRGDYAGYGYPLVSINSYSEAVSKLGLWMGDDWLAEGAKGKPKILRLLTEEAPTPHGDLPPHLSFLPDFYRLAGAPVLLRANSTFSWVAGLLNANRVLSPIVDGLMGGVEHECRFVEGNWPKFTNRDGITDLHVKP